MRHLRSSATAALLLLAVGCSEVSVGAPRQSSDPTTTSTTIAPLPPPPAWAPSTSEKHATIKGAAVGAVQLLGTYALGKGDIASARERAAAAGLPPTIIPGATNLLKPDVASSATIIYPQLGGLTSSAASVMVVARIDTQDANGDRTSTSRTIDVRLAKEPQGWRAVSIEDDGSGPPAADGLPAPVTALLGNARVELPDSAKADLRSGATDPRVAELLATLSERWELKVAVLATGHPKNVFETDRTSNHTAGRGVDIWAVDGVAVIDQRNSEVLRALVAAALAAGATEIGAPFDTDGPGGRVFANDVHLDHLHLAFRQP